MWAAHAFVGLVTLDLQNSVAPVTSHFGDHF
jgi:hypothetical protein